ncbi:uncharacterized protein FIBRA_01406 [Fibroporia radiculosa]|uniref:Uncharacterized protein n=1 Tax=Fibroporia radiculosa TaxID=599839 RepID=J4G0Z0_9APHY|nr:uncharacterized protein FIBRA_01406 [Fibroporia radiculosa]CCL99388.1 predicted protein [Fibroporia radiculosa]
MSPVRRALTPASCDALLARRPSASSPATAAARRPMSAAPAFDLHIEDAHPTPDFQIFDIFDAPARLGESSKLLMRSASARTLSSRPARPVDSTFVRKNTVQPLPAPIIFDGPTRPRAASTTLGASRARSTSAASAASSLPFSLPAPKTFDGPSRLRPYQARDDPKSSAVTPSLLVLLGVSGFVGIFGWEKLTEVSAGMQHRPDHELARFTFISVFLVGGRHVTTDVTYALLRFS